MNKRMMNGEGKTGKREGRRGKKDEWGKGKVK